MDLFDDDLLDEYETRKKVKYFMTHTVPKIINMADKNYVNVKSPIISGMPTSHTEINANDVKYTIHIEAKEALQKIIESCSRMPKNQRLILELRYLKMMQWWEIENETNYGRTRATALLNDALIMFAWNFKIHKNLLVFKDQLKI